MTTVETTLIVAGVSIVLSGAIGGFIAWVITHVYYRKQKKDSDQLPEKIGKYLVKIMLVRLIAALEAMFPDQPITPEVKAIFTGIVKSTAAAISNYDYTAKGGLRLWGEAETIIGGPEGEIPPIIDDLET
ncbi:MAG: hypothetical protein ACUZ8I_12530 [Candidatus Scalindua sp.]